MQRSNRLPKSDIRHIFFIGLGFMAMAYLLDCTIDAVVGGENVYEQIFFPSFKEIVVRLTYLSLLFGFIVYVLNLLLKRRRLEEALVKYQAGMDASVDGIAILNGNYECVYANSSYARLYGYGSHAELAGLSWRLFYDDDEMRRFTEEVFPIVREKGEWRGEAGGRRRDGSVFPQELSLTTIDRHGIVCIVRDITDHKDFEAELERKARELAAANRELEAFSYSLTHDMRNYITRSSSAVQLLRESYGERLDDEGRYLIKTLCDTNKDMEALVSDMLVLARIIRSEIRREEVDLSEIVRAIAADLQLGEPGRRVEFVIAPGLSAECDSQLVKVALENLLGNAWKYTGTVPEARVEFGAVEVKGKNAFYVRDNGVGFAMEEADQLFRPFQRLRNARAFPGTGIGLATVQRVILRHGGEVWGEGAIGAGATFYFTLPGAPAT